MNFKILTVAATGVIICGTLAIATPRSAQAKPEFAAQTGKACGACHQNPAGGGALKPFGDAFKLNGNKLPGKR